MLAIVRRSAVALALNGRLAPVLVAASSVVLMTACGGGATSDGARASQEVAATTTSVSPTERAKDTLANVTGFDAASATRIAGESEPFTLVTATTVYYGANGSFVALQLGPGTYYANNSLFGDPIVGVVKAAYVPRSQDFDINAAVKIANENQNFTLLLPGLVYYGANGSYSAKQLVAGQHTADNATFGDPIPYTVKSAYVMDPRLTAAFDVATAKQVASENGSFTLRTSATVYYGANGMFVPLLLAAGTYLANNTLFGDPAPGVVKSAYVANGSSAVTFDEASAVSISGENGQFTLTSMTTVYFGADGLFTSKQLSAGTYYATTALFGDPISGVFKSAFVVGPATPAGQIFPDGSRRVWIHQMIQIPTFQTSTPFGADYPLTLRAAYESPKRPQDTPALLAQAGITGVQLLYGEGTPAGGQVEGAMLNLDGTGIEFAPCLSIDTVEGGVAMVAEYLQIAARHPSAGKIVVGNQTKYIISIYGSRYMKTVAFWQSFRSRLAALNLNVFIVADVVTATSIDGGFFPNKIESFAVASIASYMGLFDANWTFDDGVDTAWNDIMQVLGKAPEPFAGGMLPAYNRESDSNGGYSDAEATAKFRRQWEDALSAGLAWNHVVSWNDVSERHSIWPSSEWSYTRADVNAFYSARLRGSPWPDVLKTPQLYVTVPQRINVGAGPRIAEALVLNSSSSPVTVNAQLIDANGARLGDPVSTVVGPNQSGAATFPLQFSTMPVGRFVRVRASSFDGSGTLLQQVISSPVLVFAAGEQVDGFDASRVKYNSMAARKALPGVVNIAFAGNPTSGSAVATPLPPSATVVRFADVLQNGYLAGTQMQPTATFDVAIPVANHLTSSGPTKTPASGFYVARIIDQDERIGYSDPVYFALPTH